MYGLHDTMMFIFIYVFLQIIVLQSVHCDRKITPSCVFNENNVLKARQKVTDLSLYSFFSEDTAIVTIRDTHEHNYTVNQVCFWRLNNVRKYHKLQIQFERFSLENSYGCMHDYLAIEFPDYQDKNLKFCGESFPKMLELRPEDGFVDIVFRSDLKLTGSGFNLSINSLPINMTKVFNITVENSPMYLYSPGYPGDYYSLLDYKWILKSNTTDDVLLQFLYFDMEDNHKGCEYDFIKITARHTRFTACGSKTKFILKMNDSTVEIHFQTDEYLMYGGFIMKYYSVSSRSGEQKCLPEPQGNHLIAQRNLPKIVTVTKTNGKSCKWVLSTPDVTDIIIFELLSWATDLGQCRLRLTITDFVNESGFKRAFNCIGKVVNYYRSSSDRIEIFIEDSSQSYQSVGNLSFSYYSIPFDVFTDEIIHVDERPSFVWFPTSVHSSSLVSTPQVVLKASHQYVCVQVRVSNRDHKLIEDIESHIEVFDGRNDSYHNLVVRCGDEKVTQISGTNQYMFIRQKSSDYRLYGVWLIFETASNCYGNVIKINVDESSKLIKSPNYPKQFPRNTICRWELHAVDESKIITIQTEPEVRTSACQDIMKFYDGKIANDIDRKLISQWCLDSYRKITSATDNLLISFTSNNDTDRGTFKLHVSEEDRATCSYLQLLIATSEKRRFFISPLFPGNYPNGLTCNWRISADRSDYRVQLTIHQLGLSSTDLNSCSDYVSISYGKIDSKNKLIAKYCNGLDELKEPKTFESLGEFITVHFTSDTQGGGRGFNMSYIAVSRSDDNCNTEYTVDLQPKYITSTFLGNSNYQFEDCYYRLNKDKDYRYHNIVVNVVNLDMPGNSGYCGADYIAFYDGPGNNGINQIGKLCGSVASKSFTGTTDSMFINVRTVSYNNKYNSYDGFTLKYYLQTHNSAVCSEGRPFILTAQDFDQDFTSPNYPENYDNNQYCQWRIQSADSSRTITIEVVYCVMEEKGDNLYYDYVALYNGKDRYSTPLGKFAGHQSRITYHSTGNKVFVEFKSDSRNNYSGFKLRYRLGNGPGDSGQIPTSSNSTVAMIIGSIISGIVLITVIVVCCICISRKHAALPRNNNNNNVNTGNVYNRTNNTVFMVSPVYTNNSNLPPPYPDLPPPYMSQDEPPPYCELPSYENSSQFEIPSSRSSNEILNNTQESQNSTDNPPDQFALRRYPTQTDVDAIHIAGSQENLVEDLPTGLNGIDNPAGPQQCLTTEV